MTTNQPNQPTPAEAARLAARVQAFIDERNKARDERGTATLTVLRKKGPNPLTKKEEPAA
jgi:hypothetical protein